MAKLIAIQYLLLVFSVVCSQDTEKQLFRAIDSSDKPALLAIIDQEAFPGWLQDEGENILPYAIVNNKPEIVELLIDRGADVNKASAGFTPVMWSAISKNPFILDILLKNHGKVNQLDKKGNSALVYAGSGGCLKCVQLLIESGADPMILNNEGRSALYYALLSRNQEIIKYLRFKVLELKGFREDILDGPHIKWLSKNRVKANYYFYDSSQDRAETITLKRKVKGPDSLLTWVKPSRGRFYLEKNISPSPAIYENIDSIFMVGDVHGNYYKLLGILNNSGIIDGHLNWNFGHGHLVFLGDVFDRGSEVTSILWLIKYLQSKAEEAGGKVHLLYGNHEMMILNKDERYISDKYFFLSEKAGFSYSDFYNKEYELGRWLRSLNTMVRINDILFVHAGISPELLQLQLSIDAVNHIFRTFLSGENRAENDSLRNFLLGEKGPLWYRGFQPHTTGSSKVRETDMERILNFYKVQRLIYGHSAGNKIRTDYNNRFICIDVSANTGIEEEQALFYSKGLFYRVFLSGKKELLF